MKLTTTVLRKHQKGAVAIMVGLTIFVLVAFLGMTVDLGRLFITKTELSNAADACSLAAAAELNGAADSLTRAESAGITVGQRNKVGFQGSTVVIVPDLDVTFSDHLNGTYLIKTAVAGGSIANMKYAKCTLPQTGILPYFMQVVGFGPQTVTSHAVATLAPGITNCGLPIGICKDKTPPVACADGSAPDAMGLCKNEWVCSKFIAGNGEDCSVPGSTGSFNWIDYTSPGGGASELADIITGTGECNLEIGKEVGAPGGITSLAKAWNTRFGIFQGGSTGVPDYSGFAYTPAFPASPGNPATPGSWPSKYRAYDGTSANGAPNLKAARISHLSYQDDQGTWPDGLENIGGTIQDSTYLTNNGADRRLAVVPIIDCDEWAATNHKAHIIKFACIMMLHPMSGPQDPLYLEYQGLSDLPGSPCATVGLPGGPGSVGPKVPALVR